ncbi:ribosomal protein subunit S10 [Schizosaccharomyces cryophilus OY26]|uniref:Small ribosomal subunit protein uS10m n=1 Tax=Schizosaccharomyces cryophilus (strain OY26 / ATCC MYA-4695 / CBS 11777 / NBRC 106824 / NRRL Y48691) TaxID=653667 RepID=S9W519_SCHCR|nr:ribosomal protein subunit S10 [Schizosaccharomyces cryophilus OY26]EPY53629.1 ribosomal protein subunit S10 [Schizosaccharomyces cryophilus OY26]
MFKRFFHTGLRLAEQSTSSGAAISSQSLKPLSEKASLAENPYFRELPPNVAAVYLSPLKWKPSEKDDLVASLRVKSYETNELDFYSDFICRVAYYMKIPLRGPRPLPKRIESWTLLKSPFVHKGSQENFERITHTRLFEFYNTNPSQLETFLAYVRKNNMPALTLEAKSVAYEDMDVAVRIRSLLPAEKQDAWKDAKDHDRIKLHADELLQSDPVYQKLMK